MHSSQSTNRFCLSSLDESAISLGIQITNKQMYTVLRGGNGVGAAQLGRACVAVSRPRPPGQRDGTTQRVPPRLQTAQGNRRSPAGGEGRRGRSSEIVPPGQGSRGGDALSPEDNKKPRLLSTGQRWWTQVCRRASWDPRGKQQEAPHLLSRCCGYSGGNRNQAANPDRALTARLRIAIFISSRQ